MIKILSQNVINKIAAGEVVERPSSVVKELIENSLDAGADEIKIYIEEFGTKKIQIIDNGNGVKKDDFDNLFTKHATSKITEVEDLDQIKSFGFRGEALASIASVSEILFSTKHSEDDLGSEIIAVNGRLEEIKPHSIQKGSNITVNNLFTNIPARKKFLKSKATENKAIIEVIQKFILANPEVSFYYNIDGTEKSFSKDKAIARVATVLKVKIEDLIPVSIEGNIKVQGFLVHPRVFLKGKGFQHIFVNSRYINDQIISKAIRDGFDTFMMKNQYPGFVLYISMHPTKVDVNVHPRKTEVRFENSSEIYTSIRFGVNRTLLNYIKNETHSKIASIREKESRINQSNSTLTFNEEVSAYTAETSEKAIEEFEAFLNNSQSKPRTEQQKSGEYLNKKALEFNGEVIQIALDHKESEMEKPAANDLNLDLENATQLLNSYIITSNGKEILLIDQHAASERFFYEKFLKELKNKKVSSKVLLFPESYDFNESDIDIILKYAEKLKQFGFKIEAFGKDQIKIIQVPDFLKLKDFEKIFLRIVEDILENEEISNIEDKINHEIAAILACHTAVRFGDRLTKQEIIQILQNLLLCEDPYNCPHGRPIIQDHSQYDIEKRFKRCGI